MANSNECHNCGATLVSTEKYCKYCGSLNPNYVEKKIISKPASFNEVQQSVSNTANKINDTLKEKKINWVLAILLFIFVWPIGLIYIVVKASK